MPASEPKRDSKPELTPRPYSLLRRMLLLLVPPLAALVIRCLAATLRFEVIAEPGATPIVTGTTGVCCFWHQCLLTCTCFFSGRFEASVLISQSFDGELIARTAGRLGFQAARGSSSRGGFAGLRDLTTALKSDVPAVFPADGPRGPRYRLKPGAIKLAQLTQLPLGLVHAFPERHWQLNSWDGFLIPTPFSRVVICWSRLFHIEREMTPAAFEDTRIEIEAALESVRLMAETHFARKLSS